jgi:hypothetical protein
VASTDVFLTLRVQEMKLHILHTRMVAKMLPRARVAADRRCSATGNWRQRDGPTTLARKLTETWKYCRYNIHKRIGQTRVGTRATLALVAHLLAVVLLAAQETVARKCAEVGLGTMRSEKSETAHTGASGPSSDCASRQHV